MQLESRHQHAIIHADNATTCIAHIHYSPKLAQHILTPEHMCVLQLAMHQYALIANTGVICRVRLRVDLVITLLVQSSPLPHYKPTYGEYKHPRPTFPVSTADPNAQLSRSASVNNYAHGQRPTRASCARHQGIRPRLTLAPSSLQ